MKLSDDSVMTIDEYQTRFSSVMMKLEETGKVDVMRGVLIGLLMSEILEYELHSKLLLSLTYLTVQATLNENSAFAEITKSLHVTAKEGELVQQTLKELLKKEPENGTAN